MISELTLAIAERIGLGALAEVIHPYPTQAEAFSKLGDQYNRTRLTPCVKRLFGNGSPGHVSGEALTRGASRRVGELRQSLKSF